MIDLPEKETGGQTEQKDWKGKGRNRLKGPKNEWEKVGDP